jgi:hypothetical protein
MRDGTGLDPLRRALPRPLLRHRHLRGACRGLRRRPCRRRPAPRGGALLHLHAARRGRRRCHDVCLQNLPVVFCLDRAGVVGADGPTHHGLFDIPMLRALPNLTMMQPARRARTRRDAGPGPLPPRTQRHPLPARSRPRARPFPRPSPRPRTARPRWCGASACGCEGGEGPKPPVWIWALGDMLPLAGRGARRTRGARRPRRHRERPLPQAARRRAPRGAGQKRAPLFATLENGAVAGGFGSALSETLDAAGDRGAGAHASAGPTRFQGQGPTDLARAGCVSRQAIAGRRPQPPWRSAIPRQPPRRRARTRESEGTPRRAGRRARTRRKPRAGATPHPRRRHPRQRPSRHEGRPALSAGHRNRARRRVRAS